MTAPIIKQTPLPDRGLTVVTAKLTHPHRIRQFQTFTIDDRSGHASPVFDFVSAAAAFQCHDRLVHSREQGGQCAK